MIISEMFFDGDTMFGQTEPYETACETKGDLFRALRAEYGRCTGKVYVDAETGPKPIGWVFLSRDRYDTGETYLREVWVSVGGAA